MLTLRIEPISSSSEHLWNESQTVISISIAKSPKLDSADFIICQMSLSLRFRPPNRENVVSHKAISCTIIFVFLFQCQAINHRRWISVISPPAAQSNKSFEKQMSTLAVAIYNQQPLGGRNVASVVYQAVTTGLYRWERISSLRDCTVFNTITYRESAHDLFL
jgi:hypothetical protein